MRFIASPETAKLFDALAKAQGEMRAAQKDSINPHFKSKYADLASLFEAIREPLARHGLSVIQCPSAGEGREVYMTTIIAHESGEYISSELRAMAMQETPQALGSTITYLRRYALGSMLGVVSDVDDDGNAASQTKPQSQGYDDKNPQHVAWLKSHPKVSLLPLEVQQEISNKMRGKSKEYLEDLLSWPEG